MAEIKRIAINTGGGDAPGLNAVIRSAVISGLNRGWEVIGIKDGYNGIFLPQEYPDGDGLINLSYEHVKNITSLGGTILGTTNKGNPFKYPMRDAKGNIVEVDRSDEIIYGFKRNKIDALIAIGGDGSLTMAHALSKKGLTVVGVPKTIDNDLEKTDVTFGFDTAVSFATECIDRLHSTAQAHKRVIVVEVMGRHAGWIALYTGISGDATAILIPEIPYDIKLVADHLNNLFSTGKRYAIIVVAEGTMPKGGHASIVEQEAGKDVRLGGAAKRIAAELQRHVDRETRTIILGHLLRGGSPTTFDRLLSLRFGAAAIRALEEGKSGVMVAIDPPDVHYVPLEQISQRMKLVNLNSDIVQTARDLGICFGDK